MRASTPKRPLSRGWASSDSGMAALVRWSAFGLVCARGERSCRAAVFRDRNFYRELNLDVANTYRLAVEGRAEAALKKACLERAAVLFISSCCVLC